MGIVPTAVALWRLSLTMWELIGLILIAYIVFTLDRVFPLRGRSLGEAIRQEMLPPRMVETYRAFRTSDESFRPSRR